MADDPPSAAFIRDLIDVSDDVMEADDVTEDEYIEDESMFTTLPSFFERSQSLNDIKTTSALKSSFSQSDPTISVNSCPDLADNVPRTDQSKSICAVCSAAGSGRYFGAFVCLPCKSFFIRCTRYEGQSVSSKKCSGACAVSKQSRTRCQSCRYQRCLNAGMCRKEKPVYVVPGDGQSLCSVCGDIANGVHFGVYTCEGCKKFFRRGITENGIYHCKKIGKCVINPRSRNTCRACRYRKCISVGMSRKAIKMGRPRRSTLSPKSPKEELPDSVDGMAASDMHTIEPYPPPPSYSSSVNMNTTGLGRHAPFQAPDKSANADWPTQVKARHWPRNTIENWSQMDYGQNHYDYTWRERTNGDLYPHQCASNQSKHNEQLPTSYLMNKNSEQEDIDHHQHAPSSLSTDEISVMLEFLDHMGNTYHRSDKDGFRREQADQNPNHQNISDNTKPFLTEVQGSYTGSGQDSPETSPAHIQTESSKYFPKMKDTFKQPPRPTGQSFDQYGSHIHQRGQSYSHVHNQCCNSNYINNPVIDRMRELKHAVNPLSRANTDDRSRDYIEHINRCLFEISRFYQDLHHQCLSSRCEYPRQHPPNIERLSSEEGNRCLQYRHSTGNETPVQNKEHGYSDIRYPC